MGKYQPEKGGETGNTSVSVLELIFPITRFTRTLTAMVERQL